MRNISNYNLLKHLIFAFGTINIVLTIISLWLTVACICCRDDSLLTVISSLLLDMVLVSNWIFIYKAAKY